MSILIVDVTKNANASGFSIDWAVTSHSGIEPEVFVYRTVDDTFMHVASVDDMLTFGVSASQGVEFYRKDTASVSLETLGQAKSLVAIVDTRLDILVEDYDKIVNDFVGSKTSSHIF